MIRVCSGYRNSTDKRIKKALWPLSGKKEWHCHTKRILGKKSNKKQPSSFLWWFQRFHHLIIRPKQYGAITSWCYICFNYAQKHCNDPCTAKPATTNFWPLMQKQITTLTYHPLRFTWKCMKEKCLNCCCLLHLCESIGRLYINLNIFLHRTKTVDVAYHPFHCKCFRVMTH